VKKLELKIALGLFKLNPLDIIPLQGDGSERKFFRLKFKNYNLILILPQKGEFGIKEAEHYVVIGNFLKKNDIPVPEVKDWYQEKGYILVEDLGDLRLYEAIKFSADAFYYYFKAIEILTKLQQIPQQEILKKIELLYYTPEFVFEKEILYGLRNLNLDKKMKMLLKAWIKEVFKKLKSNDFVLLHRDFQSKNFMIKKGKLYVIDFQSMMIGPRAYDLSALIFDPYIMLPQKLRERLLNYYLQLSGKKEILEELKDIRCFRLFQALGAFYRLSALGKKWFSFYIEPTKKLLKEFLPESSFSYYLEVMRYL
jgi:aminoglycoside/choline kinase family phosphotransferase